MAFDDIETWKNDRYEAVDGTMVRAALFGVSVEQVPEGAKVLRSQYETLSGTLFRAFGMAVLQPPSGRFTQGTPLRLFFTLFEFLFLLFTTVYSSALESYLTVPVFYPPIDSPLELYESGLPWTAGQEAWIYSMLGATQPHIQGLVDRFEAYPEAEKLVELSKKQEYGFAIEIMAAGHVTEQEHLTGEMVMDYHVMKEELYRTPSVTVLRKGSPYTEKINALVNRCLDAGLLLLWEGDVAVKQLSSRLQTALKISESSSQEIHHPKKLKLKHVQGAFIILILGLTTSLLLLIWELLRETRCK